MKPTKCVACQNENLFFGRLAAGVYPGVWGVPAVRPNAAVCLSCGFINAYVSEDLLDKVKGWKAKE